MDPRIASAIEIIEKNYGDHLHLSQVARQVGVSPSRLEHLFKQEAGQTYKSYLQITHMAQAKGLLSNLRLSIKEITLQVGYSQTRNFTRAFKKRFGKTPLQYRNEISCSKFFYPYRPH